MSEMDRIHGGRTLGAKFMVTKEYRRFSEFLDACLRYRYIGLCYGPPGVGKTLSARHYADWDLIDEYRTLPEPPPRAAETVQCKTALYTPSVANTTNRVEKELRISLLDLKHAIDWALHLDAESTLPRHLGLGRNGAGYAELLIVDEADRLKTAALEHVRDFYDRSGIGLVLIGMPGIEKRLARYPQLYSRIGFVHEYRTISPEEMSFILERKWEELGLAFSPDDFTDAETMAAIARITGGNFRLLQRLFSQIERVLEVNYIKTITKEVVDKAREAMVIGPLG